MVVVVNSTGVGVAKGTDPAVGLSNTNGAGIGIGGNAIINGPGGPGTSSQP